jgi:ceramide synthetase
MAALVELFTGSFSSSASVDWEAESYPAYGDYVVLPILVAFFPALRFLLDRFVFEVNCLTASLVGLVVHWIRNARVKL